MLRTAFLLLALFALLPFAVLGAPSASDPAPPALAASFVHSDPPDGTEGDGIGSAYSPAPPAMPTCVTNTQTEYHVQAIYAVPVTATNRYPTMAPLIRDAIQKMNGHLRMESGGQASYRVACTSGVISVLSVPLSITPGAGTYQTITAQLRLQHSSTFAKYLVYWDDDVSCGCGGQAQWDSWDSSPGALNANNVGPDYALDYKPLAWTTLMHELTHTMGAVFPDAPESSGTTPVGQQTGGRHCNDGLDVMCYSDGGTTSNYRADVCSDYPHLDCRHDTYFGFYPRGSYLATHWNVGNASNRFLQVACATPPSTAGFDGFWYLRQSPGGGTHDMCIQYGSAGDEHLVGDWDGDGNDSIGLVRGNVWSLNDDFDGGTDITLSYGLDGDKKIVGDWDGDGRDTPGVVRGNEWYLDNGFDGVADETFTFGSYLFPDDVPMVGDWDGDGDDDVALLRASGGAYQWHFDTGRDGTTNLQIPFGAVGDHLFVGDFDGDGRDGIGYVQANTNLWRIDHDRNTVVDQTFNYGSYLDTMFFAGDWNGDHRAGPAVAR